MIDKQNFHQTVLQRLYIAMYVSVKKNRILEIENIWGARFF